MDAGTTGVKAIVFDRALRLVSRAYKPIKKNVRPRGRVEQDPEEIIRAARAVMRSAVKKSGVRPRNIVGLGITNQRETAVAWDASSGRALYPAIVWEDTRTAEFCVGVRRAAGAFVRRATGLFVEPYFSASKYRWLLDNAPEVRARAAVGNLHLGTIDSWLLRRLCVEKPHATDYTNAARTLLFNARTLKYDARLGKLFGVPLNLPPRAYPSQHLFGTLDRSILGVPVPVRAVVGDQQASAFAALKNPNDAKITFGTGTFVSCLLPKFELHDGWYTMLIPGEKKPRYALEAKINGSGVMVTRALGNGARLKRALRKLSRDAAQMINKLPRRPQRVVIDGGIVRDGIIAEYLRHDTGLPVIQQDPFDGTALGTAALVFGKEI